MRTAAMIVLLAAAPAAAQAQPPAQSYPSQAGPLAVETIARGLDHPWAIAFLPDGRLMVSERPGRLRLIAKDGALSPPLSGVPPVFARRQGGLLDVALDRDFATNRTLFFCYAESADGGARTTLARARLADDATRLDDVRPIFRQEGPLSSGNHFGCRIAQASDGNLFLTLGDHFGPRDEAQNLANHIGKIVRVTPDGAAPPDNPFVGRKDARQEIWSYGHRNSQGAAIHPVTGRLWMHEHGPRGGDELNIPQAGKNYGWPVIGYGVDYSGARIHEGTHKAGMEQPIRQWTPVIAASGMAFYTADLVPAWKGSLFIGGLAGKLVVRLELDGDKVVKEERLLAGLGERIRDVRAGPDGALWLLTDSSNGRVLRVVPGK